MRKFDLGEDFLEAEDGSSQSQSKPQQQQQQQRQQQQQQQQQMSNPKGFELLFLIVFFSVY
jgi:hypothetical protein